MDRFGTEWNGMKQNGMWGIKRNVEYFGTEMTWLEWNGSQQNGTLGTKKNVKWNRMEWFGTEQLA